MARLFGLNQKELTMKRFAALILSTALAAVAVTACNRADDAPNRSPLPSTSSENSSFPSPAASAASQ